MLCRNEESACTFARSHFNMGRKIIDAVSETLRYVTEQCDNVQGCMMHHSIGGGTGSGLGALILERLAVDYRKKCKIGCEVMPSSLSLKHADAMIVEPYNAMLAVHWLLDHTGWVACILYILVSSE